MKINFNIKRTFFNIFAFAKADEFYFLRKKSTFGKETFY